MDKATSSSTTKEQEIRLTAPYYTDSNEEIRFVHALVLVLVVLLFCVIFYLEQITAERPTPLSVLLIISSPWDIARIDQTPALFHRHSFAAVFEIHRASTFEPLPYGGQHSRRRTLFGTLEDVEQFHDVTCIVPRQNFTQSTAGCLQTCSDAARVDRETPYPRSTQRCFWRAVSSRDLGGHVYICQLTLGISCRRRVRSGLGEVDVVKMDVRVTMRCAAEGYDARLEGHCRRSLKSWKKEIHEEEMCQMIDTEVALEAVFGSGKRDVSDTCVGDEDVELRRLCEEGRCARPDGGQGVEVQLEEMDFGIGEEICAQCFTGFG